MYRKFIKKMNKSIVRLIYHNRGKTSIPLPTKFYNPLNGIRDTDYYNLDTQTLHQTD